MSKAAQITRDFYDKYTQEFYEKTKKFHNSPWFISFMRFLPSCGKVLDLGCAFGRDSKMFAKNGFETYGVDFSSQMIKKAKKLVPSVKFEVMDVLDLKFKNNFFDGVWCSAVLLHLKKVLIPKALYEINRVLKKSGVLFVYLKEGSNEGIIKDKRYGGVEKYYSYFQKDEFIKFLTETGFKVVKSKRINFTGHDPGIYFLAVKT
jgi:ubiquinone/menaquinone biosynthesis C-methylase UbiE